ncbi:tRNA (N(6)-L-threonylcarbamoyladenosine(37)-C(2))-methylthiotransferase MtaB [Frisingicoccus sp.]|uniref:tRNA (N(6)-L-threonylcarbamoyladenosine(37)-C(2))- methylthiotransferase MtaB n=1 Tax=Frisingicoccus sp. TaxID=1918627 RepID=UPI003AB4D35B
MKSVAFCTLGCKVNQYETDAMEELFQKSGYAIRDFHEAADVYVINTCTVTNMADRKSRQMLHRARKKNPDAVIVAAGCYVQASAETIEADTAIDLIVGNNRKGQIVDMVEEFMERHNRAVNLIDINHTSDYETLGITRVSEHTRAYIKIQDGCNQFCSYCIIPYARGRVRSRKAEEIIAEVSGLAAAGYKEIVLTGIHISSYGTDFGNIGLADLVERLAAVKGIERIRFGSLEPGIVTEEFVRRLTRIPQICPHFHLSLQSGCGETLKRMNRHYTPEDYKQRCELLRKYFDRPAFTTDVIVGFPGETDEEFEATEKFLEEIHFAEMHVFKYSPRKGTRAAKMPDQVNETVKTQRSARLLALGEKMSEDYRKLCEKKVLEVLAEEPVSVDGETFWTGHSREYIKCGIPSDKILSNQVVRCQMTGTKREDFVICEIID